MIVDLISSAIICVATFATVGTMSATAVEAIAAVTARFFLLSLVHDSRFNLSCGVIIIWVRYLVCD